MKPMRQPRDVEEALRFAREMAASEIESIDRIHKRTLVSLGVIVASVTILGGIFGWVGYENTRNAVVAVADQETTKEVQDRLKQSLTQEAIEGGVKKVIAEQTKNGLQTEIHNEVSVGIRHEFEIQKPQIERLVTQRTTAVVNDVAPKLADAAVRERLQARSLTAAQEETLLSRLRQVSPGYQIEIHAGNDAEQQNYAAQFQRVFQEAGWKVLTSRTMRASEYGSGLALGLLDNRANRQTNNVATALSFVGIAAPTVNTPENKFLDGNHTTVLLLILPAAH